jgi:hypothetical protein
MLGFISLSYNVHNAGNDEQMSVLRNVNWLVSYRRFGTVR